MSDQSDKTSLKSNSVKSNLDMSDKNRLSNDSGRDRTPSITRSRGFLSFRKRGPFSKWKHHFVVLDEDKSQMTFYKSEDDHDRLASCKLSVDLRFVIKVVPSRSGILKRRFAFKLHRRAGLSTVHMAADSEEERAKWITTIENLIQNLAPSLERDPSVKSQSLPVQNVKQTEDSDSGSSRTSSVPDIAIKPRKVSRPGFSVDSNQISSVKLRRVSSETKSVSPEPAPVEDRTSQASFGVTLKKVDIEEIKRRKSKDTPTEEPEFQAKLNSLSRPRPRSPNIPLSEKLKLSKEETSMSTSPKRMTLPSSLPRGEARKRSQGTNIPLSDSVKSVIKHSQDLSESPEVTDVETLNVESSLKRQGSRICHATTTEIQNFDYEISELESSKIDDERKSGSNTEPVRSLERSLSSQSESSDTTVVVKLSEDDEVKPFIKDEYEEISFDKPQNKTVLGDKLSITSESSGSSQEDISAIPELQDEEGASHSEPVTMDSRSEIKQLKKEFMNSTLSDGSSIECMSINSNTTDNSEDQSHEQTLIGEQQLAEKMGETLSNSFLNDTLNDMKTSIELGKNSNSDERLNSDNTTPNQSRCSSISSEGMHEKNDINARAVEMTTNESDTEPLKESSTQTTAADPTSIHKLTLQISVSDENNKTIDVDPSSSPVLIRKNVFGNVRTAKSYENISNKRPSNMSILSSESDDPLPRHNFLGKSDRSSMTSYLYSEQYSTDREDLKKNRPRPQIRHSLIHFQQSVDSSASEEPIARISYIEVEETEKLTSSSSDDEISRDNEIPYVMLGPSQSKHASGITYNREEQRSSSSNSSSNSDTELENDILLSSDSLKSGMNKLPSEEEDTLTNSGMESFNKDLDELNCESQSALESQACRSEPNVTIEKLLEQKN